MKTIIDRHHAITGLLLGSLLLPGCSGHPPENLGVFRGQLSSCPNTPNCVSSTDSGEHQIEPIHFSGSWVKAKDTLKRLIQADPQATITQEDSNYIRTEYQSKWMGFIDDVEFYITENSIQVRSASRVGYSDLGANRKRIEELRAAFQSESAQK